MPRLQTKRDHRGRNGSCRRWRSKMVQIDLQRRVWCSSAVTDRDDDANVSDRDSIARRQERCLLTFWPLS